MMKEFVKYTGIIEQIEAQKITIAEQSEGTAKSIMSQITSGMGELPAPINDMFQKESIRFMKKTANLIDTESAVSTYIELISKELSEKEIKKILEFYKSEVGIKYTQTNIKITPEWTKSFMDNINQKLMADIRQFAENLKKIIDDHIKK